MSSLSSDSLYVAFVLTSLFLIAQIVTVVLENYEDESRDSNSNQTNLGEEVGKTEGSVFASPNVVRKVSSWKMVVNDKGNLNVEE